MEGDVMPETDLYEKINSYSSQVSLRNATSQPHLNFAAQKGGCSRPNHGHTHLNSKVFRCCLNSNDYSLQTDICLLENASHFFMNVVYCCL